MKYEKVLDWLIPVLLGAAIYTLRAIQRDINQLDTSIAILTEDVHDYGRRLDALESAMWKREHGG
jgi:hypothetical protein